MENFNEVFENVPAATSVEVEFLRTSTSLRTKEKAVFSVRTLAGVLKRLEIAEKCNDDLVRIVKDGQTFIDNFTKTGIAEAIGKVNVYPVQAKMNVALSIHSPSLVRKLTDAVWDLLNPDSDVERLNEPEEDCQCCEAAKDQITPCPPVGVLFGKTFALSGSFPDNGVKVKEIIKNHGGAVACTLGDHVNVVLVGKHPGNFAAEASERGIDIMTFEGLRLIVNRGGR
jgi:NAD-dependent DNA ligase